MEIPTALPPVHNTRTNCSERNRANNCLSRSAQDTTRGFRHNFILLSLQDPSQISPSSRCFELLRPVRVQSFGNLRVFGRGIQRSYSNSIHCSVRILFLETSRQPRA